MSISDDIKKLNANLYNEEVKKTFSEKSMPELSQVWLEIESDSKKQTSTPEEKTSQEKEFSERKESLSSILTPELMLNKANDYLASIESGNFDLSDFSAIENFGSAFGKENDEVKSAIDKIKTRLGEERLKIANPLNIDMNKTGTSFDKFDIAGLDSVGIEGNQEIIGGLKDVNSPAGKTITFSGKDNKEFAAVEFDKQETALLFMEDATNGQALNYSVSKDGKLSKINDDNSKVDLDLNNLNETDKKALNFVQASKKIWTNHTKGEYDKAITKGTKVNEGQEGTKINEGQDKNKANAREEQTTISEGNEADEPANDGAGVTGDDRLQKPTGEKTDYWKEGDIIDMMFKEWFLAAANAVTDWAVRQIEYGCAAIWNQIERDYQERKAMREKDSKNKDTTQNIANTVEDIADKNINEAQKGNDKEGIIKLVQEGKVDEVLNNPLLKNLLAIKPEMKDALFNTDPQKTVPLAINVATQMELFTNKYAQTAILNAQMQNQHSYDNTDINKVFEEKKQEAYHILMQDMQNNAEKNKSNNPALDFVNCLSESVKKIEKAQKIGEKDFTDGKYDEKGQKPTPNPNLEEFLLMNVELQKNKPQAKEEEKTQPKEEEKAQPKEEEKPQAKEEEKAQPKEDKKPKTLDEEANDQQKVDENNKQEKIKIADESSNITTKEELLAQRRARCESYRKAQRGNALGDKDNTTKTTVLTPSNKKIDYSTLHYIKGNKTK